VKNQLFLWTPAIMKKTNQKKISFRKTGNNEKTKSKINFLTTPTITKKKQKSAFQQHKS
jgi:hypothetical protein